MCKSAIFRQRLRTHKRVRHVYVRVSIQYTSFRAFANGYLVPTDKQREPMRHWKRMSEREIGERQIGRERQRETQRGRKLERKKQTETDGALGTYVATCIASWQLPAHGYNTGYSAALASPSPEEAPSASSGSAGAVSGKLACEGSFALC